jgi:hypothetical protein
MSNLKIPKIYINKKNRNGEIVLIEFPKGVQGKKMWDKILLSTKKRYLKIKNMKGVDQRSSTLKIQKNYKGGRI